MPGEFHSRAMQRPFGGRGPPAYCPPTSWPSSSICPLPLSRWLSPGAATGCSERADHRLIPAYADPGLGAGRRAGLEQPGLVAFRRGVFLRAVSHGAAAPRKSALPRLGPVDARRL